MMIKKSRKNRLSYIMAVILILSVLAAVWIMVNHLGLSDALDFGAGAYYYADMPGFERWFNREYYHSSVPGWVIITLFLGWGALMMKLWVWIDRKISAVK